MKREEYRYVRNITSSDLQKENHKMYCLHIKNMEIGFCNYEEQVVIENCIIENFEIDNAWFLKGLVLKNNIIKNKVEYNMGGHNKECIFIENNIFQGLVDFFDCHFENMIIVKNNLFLMGSTLLGNKGEGSENTFTNGLIAENNLGNISLNDSDVLEWS